MSEGKALTPKQLAEIRERDLRHRDGRTLMKDVAEGGRDRRAMLSHIDRASADYDTLRTCYDGLLETGNKILAERDAALADNAQLRGDYELLDAKYRGTIEALRARVTEAERDARRYRFLRSLSDHNHFEVYDIAIKPLLLHTDYLDAAIDSALSNQREKEST